MKEYNYHIEQSCLYFHCHEKCFVVAYHKGEEGLSMEGNDNQGNPTPEEKSKVNPNQEEKNVNPEEDAGKTSSSEGRTDYSTPNAENRHYENRHYENKRGFNVDDLQGEDVSKEFTDDDIFKNKTVAALAYLIFFLPLIAAPDSKFGKFHANQGLVLLLATIAGNIILGIIPILGWILIPIFGLAIFIIAVLALVNTLNGYAKKIPLIGDINLINK